MSGLLFYIQLTLQIETNCSSITDGIARQLHAGER